jgi:FG-GAP repeat
MPSSTLNLSDLDGSNGFVITNQNNGDYYSSSLSISSAGDINGDGFTDLFVQLDNDGGYDPSGYEYALRTTSAYVVFGGPNLATSGGSIDLSTLDGNNGFRLDGTFYGNSFYGVTNLSVTTGSDLNGDGIADLIVSTPYDFLDSISSLGTYVVFGGTDVGAGGSIDRSTLDGTNGFVINGAEQNNFFADSVITDSDLNGDGIADLIISDPSANVNGISNAGAIYVVFGGTNMGVGGSIDPSTLDGTNGFVINGTNQNDFFGNYVTTGSDINGDGIADLIFGIPNADPNGIDFAGSISVVFGGTNVGAGGSIDPSTLDGSNGFVINGTNQNEGLGGSVTTSDINGDGITDLIIAAPNASPNGIRFAGSTYVVFGGTDLGAGGSIDPSTLDGTNGFVINGTNERDNLGSPVKTGSDLNNDGVADLIIGVPNAEVNGIPRAGSISVVFGGTDVGEGGNIDVSSLDGSNGFVINGTNREDFFGSSVKFDSDLNGDGIADLIIRAPNADVNGIVNAGATYVVFGGANIGAGGSIDASTLDGSNGFVINGVSRSFFPKTDSDLNGDGIADLIIRDPSADPNGIDFAGSISVVFGGANMGAGGSIDVSTLDGTNGFVINGTNQYDSLGKLVSTESDINNDGIADLIIGVPNADPNDINNAGSTYVVFGGMNMGGDGTLNLADLDGSNGFVINGFVAGEGSGSSIRGLGDINGDGIDDVIIGTSGFDTSNNTVSSYVVFGSAGTESNTSADLENSIDSFVSLGSLTSEQLSITQNTDDTLLSVSDTGNLLATFTGVPTNLITTADFV